MKYSIHTSIQSHNLIKQIQTWSVHTPNHIIDHPFKHTHSHQTPLSFTWHSISQYASKLYWHWIPWLLFILHPHHNSSSQQHNIIFTSYHLHEIIHPLHHPGPVHFPLPAHHSKVYYLTYIINSPLLTIQLRYAKGHLSPDSTISHKDAATLHFIKSTIGDINGAEWGVLLTRSLQSQGSCFTIACQFLQAAYMVEPHKDNFWKYHNALWKSLIWNTYRDTLFHNSTFPSSLVYKGSYNISNQMDPTDSFFPFHFYLTEGAVPFQNFDIWLLILLHLFGLNQPQSWILPIHIS